MLVGRQHNYVYNTIAVGKLKGIYLYLKERVAVYQMEQPDKQFKTWIWVENIFYNVLRWKFNEMLQ